MKKIIISFVIAALIVVILTFSARAAKISLNGEVVELPAYNIKDNNYFKLRDVANILKGSEVEFDVQWNEYSQTINLVSNTPYSGTEAINPATVANAIARNSDSQITRDGIPVLLKAYNINFNNYFKLRDLGALFNFNITWDENNQLIGIDTSSPYEYPEYTGTDFALNTKYLNLLGKRKREVDALCGTPEHFSDPKNYIDYYIYPNGIRADYGLFLEHTDNSPLYNISIKLSDLFYNCPETVTMEQVQKLFVETVPYEGGISINYCGKSLGITFKDGVAKADDRVAGISVNGGFQSTITEVVYVGAEWKNTLEKTEGRIAYEFVMENFKSFKVPGGNTYSYEDINFELIDVSGDGIRELFIEVYDEVLGTEYRALYVRNGTKYNLAFGGTNFHIVHNYVDNIYLICEYSYVDGENYHKTTQKYYSWKNMKKQLVLEDVWEYKNDTDYQYYNGKSADKYSEEQRNYYYNFAMFYPVYAHSYSSILHS